MKTIVCFGDSNTWGACPYTGTRYGAHVRWTGLLQDALGSEYRIIEAGLNGRTTSHDEPDDPYLNGCRMLVPTLRQAFPVDFLIIMLGTNDLKRHSAWEAGNGILQLIKLANSERNLFTNDKPEILVISPITVEEPYFTTMADSRGYCNHAESLLFAHTIGETASQEGVHFMDAATITGAKAQPNGDGIHLDNVAHKELATAILEKLSSIFDK